MTFELKVKMKKFREIIQARTYDYRGIKNNKILSQEELELMLQIINQLEEELFTAEMWANR